jgi:hypothetical protein
MLHGLVFVAAVLIQAPFIFRRQRRRYRNLGKRLGLTEGDVLSSTFTGGALTTSELRVVSLRSGAWPDVVALVTGRVGQEGYRLRKPMPQSGPPPRRMYYWPPRSEQIPPSCCRFTSPGKLSSGPSSWCPRERRDCSSAWPDPAPTRKGFAVTDILSGAEGVRLP